MMSLKLNKPYKRMSTKTFSQEKHTHHFPHIIHTHHQTPNPISLFQNSNQVISSKMGDLKFSFKTQDHVHQRAKHNKKRLTEDQVAILEKCFASNMKLEPEQKFHLANQLGVPPRQVAIWYQNKRARWKTQNLEVDHGVLQAKLENVMAEKKQLERDVERLKVELKKAQEMLLIGNAKGGDCSLVCKNRTHYQEDLQQLTHFIQSSELDPFDGADHSNTNNNGSCDFSTSFEEGGSSGVLDDGTHHHHECWQSGEVMQAEELYAYFMGANFGSGLLHEKRA